MLFQWDYKWMASD